MDAVLNPRPLSAADRFHALFGDPGDLEDRTNPLSAESGMPSRQPGLPWPSDPRATQPLHVADLGMAYLVDCQNKRFSKGELSNRRSAVLELRQQFGACPIPDFGGPSLMQLQDHFVKLGWCRNYVNRQTRRVIRVFEWGVPYRFVPIHVVQELKLVPSLEFGRTPARETKPRSAPTPAEIAAVRECLAEKYRPVFDLLPLTGARPGELLSITTGMIDRSPPPDPWRCPLARHKTRHMRKTRVLYFNLKAQAILRPLLHADPDALLFPFSHSAFDEAVRDACHEALGLPVELWKDPRHLTPEQREQRARWRYENAWVPYSLRHKAATDLVDQMSLEAARHVLGHSDAAMTADYAKTAERQAKEAVKRLG